MFLTTAEETKKHLKGYIDLLRPFTLLAPLIVSSCVMVASFVYTGRDNLSLTTIMTMIMSASFSLALLNGASNALNQSTDVAEDKLSKPFRPIPKGRITPKEAQTIAVMLYTCAFLLSFMVHMLFSLFVLCIAVFTITYSIKPRMKQFLFLNQLWVAIPRGLLGILASWSVFADPFQKVPLTIGCIAALFLFGGTTTKDILDAEADKKTGIKTLINVLGVKKTAVIALLCMSTAFALIIPLIYLNILEMYLLPLSLSIILAVCISWLMIAHQKNERFENTSSWRLMYTTYFIFAFCFAILTIFFA
jgi:geranylgeranylglycerol-phosphate geranylgeranyltransferase